MNANVMQAFRIHKQPNPHIFLTRIKFLQITVKIHYYHKSPKISDAWKIAVFILKVEQCDSVVRMANGAVCVDPH